jgi:hypothetical protein
VTGMERKKALEMLHTANANMFMLAWIGLPPAENGSMIMQRPGTNVMNF